MLGEIQVGGWVLSPAYITEQQPKWLAGGLPWARACPVAAIARWKHTLVLLMTLPCLAPCPACVQVCHVSTWNRQHLAAHEHITSSKDPGLRAALRGVLMAAPEIAPRICQLSAIFGYENPECSPSSSTAAGGGAAPLDVGGPPGVAGPQQTSPLS